MLQPWFSFGAEMRTAALRCPELGNSSIFCMNSFLSIPLCNTFYSLLKDLSGDLKLCQICCVWLLFVQALFCDIVLMFALRG